MRFSAPAALLGLAVASIVTATPATAAGPSVSIQNVESRNSINGCGQFRFDADLVTSNWPAGMKHIVRYRWERSGGHSWTIRSLTLGPTPSIPVIPNRPDGRYTSSPVIGDIHEMVDLPPGDGLRVAA